MKLEELPQKIKDIETSIFAIENQFFAINEDLKDIEIPTRITIYEAINAVTGKLQYTNEQRRDDEVWMRLRASAEYQKNMNRRRDLLSQRDQLKIELKFYENTLKVMLHDKS